MRLTQVGPAVTVAVLLGATWVVPAAISAAVPAPVESVRTAGAKTTLQGLQGTEVRFTSPKGWQAPRASSRQSASFSQGDKSIDIVLLDGSEDFETTSRRVVRSLSSEGVAIAYDGGRIRGGGGFEGKTCTTIIAATGSSGRCAVVHHGSTVVTVISVAPQTGPQRDAVKSVDAILNTLELTKEG